MNGFDLKNGRVFGIQNKPEYKGRLERDDFFFLYSLY